MYHSYNLLLTKWGHRRRRNSQSGSANYTFFPRNISKGSKKQMSTCKKTTWFISISIRNLREFSIWPKNPRFLPFWKNLQFTLKCQIFRCMVLLLRWMITSLTPNLWPNWKVHLKIALIMSKNTPLKKSFACCTSRIWCVIDKFRQLKVRLMNDFLKISSFIEAKLSDFIQKWRPWMERQSTKKNDWLFWNASKGTQRLL